jgi:uncharacterized protein (TIGR03435 family)
MPSVIYRLLDRHRCMKRVLIGVLLISAAVGQPVFEVASIRASAGGRGEGSRRENIQTSPGSMNMRNVTLKSAIRWAYHVMDYQVSGPDWINFDRYDISAKAAEAAPDKQLEVMLQALLAERFKLTLHRETKEQAAYIVVPGKGGLKFHESQSDGEMVAEPNKDRTSVVLKGVPASLFIEMLSSALHAPVINKTGLEGRYDATIDIGKYFPDGSSIKNAQDIVSILMTGVEQELGLKLESKKLPIDLLIIDHAEKVPVEN